MPGLGQGLTGFLLFFCPSRTEEQKPNAAKGGKRRLKGQTRDGYYGTP
jgi:hypothetical protein